MKLIVSPNLTATLVGLVFACSSCLSEGEPRARTKAGVARAAQTSNAEGALSAGDTASDKEESKDDSDSETRKKTTVTKKKKKKTSSNSSDDSDDEELEKAAPSGDGEPLVYPQLFFNGKGETTYKHKNRLAMTQSVNTDLNVDRLALTTSAAYVSCGSKSGCKQGDVNRDVNANALGTNTYNRVSKSEMKDLAEGGFQKASFAIFSSDVEAKNGLHFTFDKPLPVYFWPVAVSRFEALDDGPMAWSSHVTTNKYFAINPSLSGNTVDNPSESLVKNGQVRKDFNVTITVTKVSRSGNIIVIRSDVDIPEDLQASKADWRGSIYEIFPVPKSATYTIDASEQVILKIDLNSWTNGDRSKEKEETNLHFELCSKVTDATTKTYPCGS